MLHTSAKLVLQGNVHYSGGINENDGKFKLGLNVKVVHLIRTKPSALSIDAKTIVLSIVELVNLLDAHFVDDRLIKGKKIQLDCG